MLEKLLDNRRLGTKSQIYQVIDAIKNGHLSLSDLKEFCTYEQYSFSLNLPGIISLLLWLNIIDNNNGNLCLKLDLTLNNSNNDFLYLLFQKLSSENKLHLFLNSDNVRFEKKSPNFLISNRLIPLSFSSLRNLMIDFNLFEKDDTLDNFYRINDNLIVFFLNKILPLIDQSKIRRNPQSDIQLSLDKKEELGRIAEDFILNFERKSMVLHSNNSNIRKISDEDCGAGFDILSYQTVTSILLDKYIEVKSYSGEPYFYWSINEVKVAEKERSNYFLYLVNRDKIDDENYLPIIIQNPYKNVFNNIEWNREPQNWKFERKDYTE